MKLLKIIISVLFIYFYHNSVSQSVWTGNIDTYWDNADNWIPSGVPSSTDNVIIPSSVSNYLLRMGSTDAECNNLTIEAGGQLTLRSSENLHIFGNLTIESPNDNSPSGSLIESGSLTVDGLVFFERYYSVNGKWKYICSPLNNSNSDLFTRTTVSGNFNPNFLRYNQAYDCDPNPSGTYLDWSSTDLVYAWENHHNGELGVAENLKIGIGYIYLSDGNIKVVYSGNTESVLNNTSIEIPVTFNSNDGNSDYYDGWNLVGNPYTSSIRWGRRSNDIDDKIYNTAYCWSSDDGQYKYINGNGGTASGEGSNVVNGSTEYIAAGQGFFVKATDNGFFSLSASTRRHDSQELWKNQNYIKDDGEYISEESPQYIKLKIESNNFTDETVIRFIKDASDSFDGAYDAYKLAGNNENIPLIYTKDINNIPVAINSLPFPNDQFHSIPLCMKAFESKEYTINLVQSEYSDLEIFLYDHYENQLLDLRKFSEYTFNFAGGLNEDRFEIIYNRNITEISANEQFNTLIYPNPSNGKFNIQTNQPTESFRLYDISGKEIFSNESHFMNTSIDMSQLDKGIYFIKIHYFGGAFKTEKLIIQ